MARNWHNTWTIASLMLMSWTLTKYSNIRITSWRQYAWFQTHGFKYVGIRGDVCLLKIVLRRLCPQDPQIWLETINGMSPLNRDTTDNNFTEKVKTLISKTFVIEYYIPTVLITNKSIHPSTHPSTHPFNLLPLTNLNYRHNPSITSTTVAYSAQSFLQHQFSTAFTSCFLLTADSPVLFLSSLLPVLLLDSGSCSPSTCGLAYPSPIAKPVRLSPNVEKAVENAKIYRNQYWLYLKWPLPSMTHK